MDTYASSAGDPGFYNIGALAVCRRLLRHGLRAEPPGKRDGGLSLTSGMFNDLNAMQQYAAVVPADKVVSAPPSSVSTGRR